MKKLMFIVTAFLMTAFVASAQDTVTGRVTDKKGNPLPGAKVLIKHTPERNDTALTDSEGFFSITWSNPYEKKMIVTYPGMETRKLNVENGRNIKMAKTSWWNKKPSRPEFYVGIQGTCAGPGMSHPALGLRLGYGKIVGVYAKAMANLDSASDDGYEGGYADSYRYYTGKTKCKYMSGALGLSIRLKSPFYLCVGGGVESRRILWQGADGAYYQKENDDPKFFVDLGLLFRYKHLAVNVGMATVDNPLNLGVGYIF